MQTDSSAMRTCMASASAVECTATERMPISRQARITRSAISPRFATRIFSNIAPSLDDEKRRAVFDGAAILDEDAPDGPAPRRGNVVHRLHRLDDEERLALLHLRADGHEGFGPRLRREVGGPHHGR